MKIHKTRRLARKNRDFFRRDTSEKADEFMQNDPEMCSPFCCLVNEFLLLAFFSFGDVNCEQTVTFMTVHATPLQCTTERE
jgi:hypothetical protein